MIWGHEDPDREQGTENQIEFSKTLVKIFVRKDIFPDSVMKEIIALTVSIDFGFLPP